MPKLVLDPSFGFHMIHGRHPVARVGERQVVLQAARTIALQGGDVAVEVVVEAPLCIGQGWRQGRTGPDPANGLSRSSLDIFRRLIDDGSVLGPEDS